MFFMVAKITLQVREDTKAGVYVENLREEFVANVHDVFRLMLKVCRLL